jgi:hypothetical protein
VKLCIDCAYLQPPTPHCYEHHCRHPKAFKTAKCPVTGNTVFVEPWYQCCAMEREDGLLASLILNTCGRRARWFKQKENHT